MDTTTSQTSASSPVQPAPQPATQQPAQQVQPPVPASQPPVPSPTTAQSGVTPFHAKEPSSPWGKIFLTLFICIIVAGCIGGAYYLGTQKFFTFPLSKKIAKTSPTPVASSTSNPTANWTTYTDPTYGFSFKYPSDFGAIPLDKTPYYDSSYHLQFHANFQTKNPNETFGDAIQINVIPNPNGLTSLEYVKTVAFRNDLPGWNNDKQPTTSLMLSGRDATRLESVAGGKGEFGPTIFIHDGTNMIEVLSESTSNTNVTIFNQILSTFTFSSLVSAGTMNWQQYAGSGFSFQYPQGWISKKNTFVPYDTYFYNPSTGSPTGNGGGIVYSENLDLNVTTSPESVQSFVYGIKSRQGPLASQFMTKPLVLDAYQTQTYYQGGEGTAGWYVPFSNGTEIVNFGPFDTDPTSQNSIELQIIRTFKFTQ